MTPKEIEQIPIAEIRVANPRTRNKVKFQIIVASIGAVGLKKPITVSRRPIAEDGTQYDLVCGQGRMEAYLALGETTIPAVVIDATREEQFLMSLVENIARRAPSNLALLKELKALLERGHKADEIARKVGLDVGYIRGVINLLENAEDMLVKAVEAGRIPISVAVEIARGNDHEVQTALSEAYEKGDLRGAKLASAKRIITQRIAQRKKDGRVTTNRKKLTGDALVREYRQQVRQQKNLVKKASAAKDRLILLITAMRKLMSDEHFVALLRAEQLIDMPEQLAIRIR